MCMRISLYLYYDILPLNKGVTIAYFHSVGIRPESRMLLMNFEIVSESSCEQNLRIFTGIPEIPGDMVDSRLFKNFSTVSGQV